MSKKKVWKWILIIALIVLLIVAGVILLVCSTRAFSLTRDP